MLLTRFLVYLLLLLLLVRALRGFFAGLSQGMRGQAAPPRRGVQKERGVRMARDPICGTFVIPANALAVRDANGLHHFCSDKCRDAFVARARRTS
jgi:YHS domain-containing protein